MSVSPEARLAALETEVEALKARIVSLESGATAAASLPDVNIDGQYGDPVVRKDPPKWKGESFAGRPFSLCSPDYLRELARFKQWCAAKERQGGKDKYAGYSMLDAARALAWAARIEESRGRGDRGIPPPEPEPDRWGSAGDAGASSWGGPDDEIPFVRDMTGVWERP